jgi:predicted metal-dependent phosphotriesterase family hydrolase
MIRTVLGDVRAETLGRTDYHEHAFQTSPLLAEDKLDDVERSAAELSQLRGAGFSAMIDATPIGLGRMPEALAQISATTGLQVVASTGAHRDAHYKAGHWLQELTVPQLSELFSAEVCTGMLRRDQQSGGTARTRDGQPVRAGMIKTGIEYWRITRFKRRVLDAAARTHCETGAPLMVHLEAGSAAFEVLDLLHSEGVSIDAVVLAHVDRNPDPGLHADLAHRGAYLGYDGFARPRYWPDSVLIDCLTRSAAAGALDRVLLGGDVARRSRYVAYGGMPGLRYLGQRVVPRLLAAGHGELVNHALTLNPARLLDRFAPDPARPEAATSRSEPTCPSTPSV